MVRASGAAMKWHRAAMAWAGISGWAAIFVAGFVSQASPASAQTFDSYRCADGTHFSWHSTPATSALICRSMAAP